MPETYGFFEMMQSKHKAYFAHWLTRNIRKTDENPDGIHGVTFFLMEPMREAINDVLQNHIHFIIIRYSSLR